MINFYFNPETSICATAESAKVNLCNVASRFCDIVKSCETAQGNAFRPINEVTIYQYPHNSPQIIASCMRLLSHNDKENVRILLSVFGRGHILTNEEIGEGKLLLEELELPSPVLEYALNHYGIALSIADEPFWHKDELKFINHERSLPNIWGNESCTFINNWLILQKRRQDKIQHLKDHYQVQCCCSIKNDDFTSKEWDEIFTCMTTGKEQFYCPDGQLIKSFSMQTTKGSLHEIRFMTCGIRFFFVYSEAKFYLGGIYYKGQGHDAKQNAAAKQAKQRISSHISNLKNKLL